MTTWTLPRNEALEISGQYEDDLRLLDYPRFAASETVRHWLFNYLLWESYPFRGDA